MAGKAEEPEPEPEPPEDTATEGEEEPDDPKIVVRLDRLFHASLDRYFAKLDAEEPEPDKTKENDGRTGGSAAAGSGGSAADKQQQQPKARKVPQEAGAKAKGEEPFDPFGFLFGKR